MYTYLVMCTLVVYLGQGPVSPVVTREEDGVIIPWCLLQLDGDGDQIVVVVNIEQAQWGSTIRYILARQAIHYLQITYVYMTTLKCR